MSMPYLTWMRTSFFTKAGGGVPGTEDGTAHGTIVQAGATIETFRLFTAAYRRAGGMTTGSAAGEEINGTTSGYNTRNFNRTGAHGKRPDIGKSRIPGVSRV